MAETLRYSRAVIIVHWLSALLLAAGFALGLSIDLWPREERPPWLNLHALIGVTLVALLIVRIIARFVAPPPPAPGSAWAQRAATVGHWILYFSIALTAMTGMRALFVRGRSINFGLFEIPSPFGRVETLIEPATELHEAAAFVLAALVVGHVAMALYHQVVLRDGLLVRMTLR